MFPILQRPYPSLGEQFVGGITKGAERGFEREENLRELQNKANIERQAQAQKLQGVLSSPFYQNAPQWQKDIIAAEASGQITPSLAKSLANFQREDIGRNEWNQYFGQQPQSAYEQEPSQGFVTEPGGGIQSEKIPSKRFTKSNEEEKIKKEKLNH